jgi:hypothetical protein
MSEIEYPAKVANYGAGPTIEVSEQYGQRIIRCGAGGVSAYLPQGEGELHKLTEAIHGRKIAAIFYELPAVTEDPESTTDTYIVHAEPDPMTYAGYSVPTADEAWKLARNYAAIARHIEAHDVAKAVEEREIEALAESLYLARYGSNATPLGQIICHDADGWRDAGRRAYELGARAPEAQ